MRGKMHGVVLWSDQAQDRAVIWCEDHGDLAFYRGQGSDAGAASRIKAGDMVAFDLCEGGEMRLARAPSLVAQESHPTLSRALMQAGINAGALPDTSTDLPSATSVATGDASLSNVVPFRTQRCAEIA
ncbi:hypothetical protein G5B38_04010 [Pseudohalocynthiibacter aestuariivivens]|uniref:Uncharacterized protein n=1 Tax=Roseovarius pelagicus TaxID=2980108 RepID=A0ABY6DHP0_9RHOB|nr:MULTISPECIES: hypothetical protein [Rhodobacterales]QIE44758.1 hypothetical protein G5B38_04010 [Pseudohalocynthiibacter aestuariivivens]UXX83330.1 hypothetical protein N7U68_01190 [Roseovarius pelagicus]